MLAMLAPAVRLAVRLAVSLAVSLKWRPTSGSLPCQSSESPGPCDEEATAPRARDEVAASVAPLAAAQSRHQHGRLARIPQAAHRGERSLLRRQRARGAVLRVDRQPGQASRRRSFRAEVHAPKAWERVVREQPE